MNKSNNPLPQEYQRHEILSILIFFSVLFLGLSFYSYDIYDLSFYAQPPNEPAMNHGGSLGAYLTFGFIFTYGYAMFLFPLFLIKLAVKLLRGMGILHFVEWLLFCQLSLVSGAILLALPQLQFLKTSYHTNGITNPGGILGTILGEETALHLFGSWGSFAIFGLIFLASLKGLIPLSYTALLRLISNKLITLFHLITRGTKYLTHKVTKLSQNYLSKRFTSKEEPHSNTTDEKTHEEKPSLSAQPGMSAIGEALTPEPPCLTEEEQMPIESEPVPQIPSKKIPIRQAPKNHVALKDFSFRKNEGPFEFPSLDLLDEPSKDTLDLAENLESNATQLVYTLGQFDIESEVVGIESGPVITRYEIQIASGVKVQKVTALDNDIAMAMRAKSVRIIAPIPGKAAIGIEIPNQIRKMVTFKELLQSNSFKKQKCQVPLVIGKNISGSSVIFDLAKMPHLLIAGATGAGKSVCINTIIMSLLYTMSPTECKIMLVDPKKVEMAMYKNIPHLFVPLITNPSKVALGLRSLIDEMDKRYQLFKDVGVRNIEGYNKKDKSSFHKTITENEATIDPLELAPLKLPYIVVIIDELADLMMVAKNEVESSIVRLAQLSRAVGIHMVLATQRPSVDVVTGLIKANIPGRIAFRVASKIDSRTVLDGMGADKLLGNGDLLFLNPSNSELDRNQGAYLSDDEINRVVEHWESQGTPQFDQTALDAISRPSTEQSGEQDPLFDDAVNAIRESGQASASFLQRRLRIGYNRASRLIDELEASGLIGPSAGSKGREIYIEENQ